MRTRIAGIGAVLLAVCAAGFLYASDRHASASSVAPRASSAMPVAAGAGWNASERGDAPSCSPIFGVPCPARDRPTAFGEGRPFCDAVPPTIVDGKCRARAAGCAGLRRNLCDGVCGYCAAIVEGAACRLKRLFAGAAARASCGLKGRDFEWQPVASVTAPATLVGIASAGGRGGCPGIATCPECAEPRLSSRDNCLTHDDRDFVLNLAVGEEALPFLSPANMVEDRAHVGRSIELESEWMYLFAPFRSVWLFDADDASLKRPRRLSRPLAYRDAQGRARALAVPLAGDVVAAQGTLAADCGHLDENGFPRMELHPTLAMAWAHPHPGGGFDVHVRASSSRAGDARRHRLAPFRVLLPLGDAPLRAASFRWEYSWRGYRVVTDRTCVLGGNDGHSQELPAAHLEGGDAGEADRLPAGRAGELNRSSAFAVRITAAPGGALIEIDPLLDEDPPALVGAHALLLPAVQLSRAPHQPARTSSARTRQPSASKAPTTPSR